MFSPRQLLVHGTFVEEHRRLAAEIEEQESPEKASALIGLLGLVQGGGLNYNSILCSWHVPRRTIAGKARAAPRLWPPARTL